MKYPLLAHRTWLRPGSLCLTVGVALGLAASPLRAQTGCGSFSIEPSPDGPNSQSSLLRDVHVIAPDDIWAVGQNRLTSGVESLTLTLHYDGNDWSVVPSPSPQNVLGLAECELEDVSAVSSDLVYAAGSYTNGSANSPDTLVLRWDGSNWEHIVSPGVSAFGAQGFLFEAVEAIDADNVWFGGQFANSPSRATMVHYDGSDFTVYSLPLNAMSTTAAHRIRAISALAPDDIWAAGSSGGKAVAVGRSYVAHFDGSSWTLMSPPQVSYGEQLNDVVAIAPDDVWVAGLYEYTKSLFWHWDGSDWTFFDSPDYCVDLVALASDDIYSVRGPNLTHWDGSSWTIVDQVTGLPGAVMSGIDAVGPCDLVGAGRWASSSSDDHTLIARYRPDSTTTVSYCTAGTSASGCQAVLSATGTASASAPSGFVVSSDTVEGQKDGLFFFGSSGRQAAPWGSGTSYQCVVPPVSRTTLLTGTGTVGVCDGALNEDLNARWSAKPAQNPGAGATVQVQLWYRDPLNTSNQTTSLSDAIEVVVQP